MINEGRNGGPSSLEIRVAGPAAAIIQHRAHEILAREGVEITPGDTAIYGFGVGRSVALAEAVVLGEALDPDKQPSAPQSRDEIEASLLKVSLTASGRVRLRVVR